MKSHIRSRLHVLVWCLLMSVAALVVATHGANAAEAPTLTLSRSSATYLENDAGFFVDGDLSITGYSGNIDGARVFIDRGYRSAEDSLQFTPSGGINGSFQSSTGILTLSGSASASAYQTVLRSVRYVNGSDNPTTTNRLITVALTGGTMYYATNGHYYEFVSNPGVSWTSAKSEAANRTLYGLRGYLATITSSGENAFLTEKVSGSAWIGASDADQEGVWKWMTGPETGTTLSYTNWNSGEPNNSGGNENYAHMMSWTSPPGMWNDLPNAGGSGQYASTGYMVEYGGMSGDPVVQLSGTVTVSVQSVNDPPRIAAGSTLTITEDSGTTQRNVIAPTDPDSSIPSLTYHIGSPPTKGTVSIARLSDGSTGQYSYRPYPNANGADSFTWYVNDGQSDSNVVTQSVSITPVNDVPSFTKGSNQTVLEDCGLQTLAGWATNISAGPPDEAGQTLTFIVTGTTNPALFSAGPAVASNGTLTYTPAPDANGTATVTVILQDNGGTANGGVDSSASQTFTITVTPVVDIVDDAVTTNEDTAITFNGITGTNGASADNFENSSRSISAVTQGTHSVSVTFLADGSITYTPGADWNGTDSFTYTVTSPAGVTETATVTITVAPVNDVPSFTEGSSQTVLEDCGTQVIPGWATAISAGPPDEAGQTLTFIVTGTTNPALFSAGPAVASNGTLTYTPAPDANGTATVTVILQDNGGTANGGVDSSASQAFTITMTPVNDAASFTRGADQTVLEDCGPQTVTPWATAISAGPPDEAGQTLTFTVTSTTNPALFRVAPAVAPDGTLTFTPAPDANGSATITVILQDNGGTANGGIDTSVPQTFTISVTPVNDAPVVSAPPLVATLEDRPVSIFGITVTDVDINETPAPNNTVRVTLTVSHGTLSMSALTGLNFSVGHGTADRSMTFIGTLTNANMALGTLSYVPDQNYNNYIGAGLEVCLVTVSDMAHTGSGGNRVALKPICISVTPANDAPVALDATWTLTGDAVFSQVLQATDIDSAFLTYVIVSPPSHGLVTITGVSSGDFTYTPTPSYCGLDTFTFKVLDESLESNVATVVLAIHPAAVAVTFDTQGGSAVPPQTVAYGSCLVEPSVPTKAGMTFAGWYTDPADGTRWDVSAPVTTDLTLYAHWTVLTFTVTPSAGDHGMISPATVQTVPYGSTVTFTIAPDPGYQIADVQVDGVSVGAVASYMFQSVMADHTIHATFAPLGSLSLAAGWNLVAVPVPLPASSIPGLLGAYSYHDGWGVVTSADTLVPGEGYWVEVSAPVPVPLPGVSSPAALSLTYQAGWQLLGNPFDIPLPLASITNGNLITHCYSYSYGPGWGVLSPATDSLQPGRGYWIYLAAPTTLTLLHP